MEHESKDREDRKQDTEERQPPEPQGTSEVVTATAQLEAERKNGISGDDVAHPLLSLASADSKQENGSITNGTTASLNEAKAELRKQISAGEKEGTNGSIDTATAVGVNEAAGESALDLQKESLIGGESLSQGRQCFWVQCSCTVNVR